MRLYKVEKSNESLADDIFKSSKETYFTSQIADLLT